jgi:hypothetical protein
LDKSHLERPRPLQISLTSNGVPTFDSTTVDQWVAMPPTYETMVQRADTAQVRFQIFISNFLFYFFVFRILINMHKK